MPFMSAEDGVPIYYTDQGEGAPIFLIHGWTMNHKYFRHNVPGLPVPTGSSPWTSGAMATPASRS